MTQPPIDRRQRLGVTHEVEAVLVVYTEGLNTEGELPDDLMSTGDQRTVTGFVLKTLPGYSPLASSFAFPRDTMPSRTQTLYALHHT